MYLFSGVLKVAALFSPKIRLMLRGRREVFRKIESLNFPSDAQVVWVHCASLGEFEQGRSLIEQLKECDKKEIKIVLTFFSPSGYEIRKDYLYADCVCYLPADTAANARRFVKAIKPDVAIFIKYEYWYNYLRELKRSGARSYMVSAIFRPTMRFFRRGGGFFRKMLQMIEHFFVQNRESVDLLASIDIVNQVTISGDTRFDRVATIVKRAPELPLVAEFAENSEVIICGSTWATDMELLIELMNDTPEVKFIIVPHVINQNEIDRIIEMSGRHAIRYSTQKYNPEATLMVVDCVGILSAVYAYGNYAYIGGGFGAGIHNILEAATWGLPVIFGPKCHKFEEAKQLLALGAAFMVEDYSQLKEVHRKIQLRESEISEIALKYIHENCGATSLIIEQIFNYKQLSDRAEKSNK